MMKTFLSLLCISIAFSYFISAEEHAHFNVDIALKNERILEKFVNCILNEGPCAGPIDKIKKEIPHLLETQCEECQEQVKILGAKVLGYIRKNKPDKWIKIQEIYDPKDEHQEQIRAMLDTYQ